MHNAAKSPPLWLRIHEAAAAFLRLGFVAFGGPAAHIAMMEQERVRKRAWLSSEESLDLLGAVNLISMLGSLFGLPMLTVAGVPGTGAALPFNLRTLFFVFQRSPLHLYPLRCHWK